jgi:hypothetical protein
MGIASYELSILRIMEFINLSTDPNLHLLSKPFRAMARVATSLK